eukprot:5925310-Lingulodinium_polyedra.AAC.1
MWHTAARPGLRHRCAHGSVPAPGSPNSTAPGRHAHAGLGLWRLCTRHHRRLSSTMGPASPRAHH